jgi:phosphoserine phosphatase
MPAWQEEMTMGEVTRIVLVRHGQTEWNVAERFRGRIDVPLDEVGLRQARAAAARLRADYSLSAVYSSPLSRASQTAEPIASAFDLPVQVLPAILDQDFGEWDGLTIPEVAKRYPEMFRMWREEPQQLKLPGGESLDDVRERVVAGLREVVGLHAGKTVALVSHRVICKVLMCAVLGLDNSHFWRIEQGNTAINEFDAIDPDRGVYLVRKLNDTCHLRELA